jgi:hypothetical protein
MIRRSNKLFDLIKSKGLEGYVQACLGDFDFEIARYDEPEIIIQAHQIKIIGRKAGQLIIVRRNRR